MSSQQTFNSLASMEHKKEKKKEKAKTTIIYSYKAIVDPRDIGP
jgi:hypothetical protein